MKKYLKQAEIAAKASDSKFYTAAQTGLINYLADKMKIPRGSISESATSVFISQRVLNELLKDSGIDLEKFAEGASNSLKSASKELTGKTVCIKTSVDSKLKKQ